MKVYHRPVTGSVTPGPVPWIEYENGVEFVLTGRIGKHLPRRSIGAQSALFSLRFAFQDMEPHILTTRQAGEIIGCAPGTAAKYLRTLHDAGFVSYENGVLMMRHPFDLDDDSDEEE